MLVALALLVCAAPGPGARASCPAPSPFAPSFGVPSLGPLDSETQDPETQDPEADAPAPDPDLAILLAQAVDLPDARARRDRARELAKRPGTSLEDWLAVCRAFAPVDGGRLAVGAHEERVPLTLPDGEVEGELVLVVPPAYDPEVPAPLLVALHGTGGSGPSFVGAWREVAEATGALLLAPTEPGPNNGFAATEAERVAVLEAVRWARRHANVDEDRVWLTGFSRGGHLTWDLGLRHPDRWAALVPMVGGPRFEIARGANNLRYLENLVHVPLRDLQGANDDPGLVFNVREAFARLEPLEPRDAEYLEFPELGHSVQWGAVDWEAFLGGARRDPLAARQVRRFAREGEGRAGWLEVVRGDREVAEEFTPEVRAATWNGLDADGKRRYLIDAVEERTGRAEARRLEGGAFEVDLDQVVEVALLLPPEWLPEKGKLEVRVRGRRKRLAAKPEARVLLEEFVERFDRRFLPVARVEVKR